MANCSAIDCSRKMCFKFPKDIAIRREWLLKINRPNFEPKRWNGLCERHFRASDFVTEGKETGVPLTVRRLKTGAVPSLLLNIEQSRSSPKMPHIAEEETTEPNVNEVSQNILLRNDSDDLGVQPLPKEVLPDFGDMLYEVYVCDVNADSALSHDRGECPEKHQDKCCGPDIVSVQSVGVQSVVRMAPYCIDHFTDKPQLLNHLTGLESYDKFMMVLFSLGPDVHTMYYRQCKVKHVSVSDRFLMTLWKLKRNLPDLELGMHFGIHQTTVSNIFFSMIKFMDKQWGKLEIWPLRDLVQFYMPEGFKKQYPSTRVIVDGTEVPIEKPKNPRAQQATYSTYKNDNTVKVLIGGSPSGLISYCSEAYGGSTSDRQIVDRSALPDLCDKGDSIMADRGFNVQDILAPKGVAINIPAFLKGKDHLSGKTIMKDRKLASKRVLIERLIGLAKTYKILKQKMNHCHAAIASEIFYVVVMLCNIRENIVSRKA